MSKTISDRMIAEIDGDFVVFLFGMRINKLWKLNKWWPVYSAMRKMMKELESNPELGMLGQISDFRFIVQYWRSFDHLESYARNRDRAHLPAWKSFNAAVRKSREDVGIWHETYQVRAGEYEALYSGMPSLGLGMAGRLIPPSKRTERARDRIRHR